MTKSFSRHPRREFLHKSHHFRRERLLWKAILLNSHPLCTTIVTGNILTSPFFSIKVHAQLSKNTDTLYYFLSIALVLFFLRNAQKKSRQREVGITWSSANVYVQKEHTNRHSSQIKILLPHHRLISAWNIQLAVMHAIAPLRAIYMTVLVLLLSFFFGLLIPHETSSFFQPVLNESWLCIHKNAVWEKYEFPLLLVIILKFR